MISDGWTTGTPAERLAEMHERLRACGDEYIAADMEAREAGKRRQRVLHLMYELRGQMRNLAAEHGLELPPLRWSALLESDDA